MKTMTRRYGSAPRISWWYRIAPLLMLAGILGLLLVLIARTAYYLRYAASAVAFPFGLDYGEGGVWQQALLIPSARMYGDITQNPFIVFEYPPVYHLLVRAAAAFGIDPLAAGRGITLIATLIIAILAGSIAFIAMQESTSTRARMVGSLVAGLMVFTYQPVEEWAVLMRVDMLAFALAMAGVYLSIVARHRTITLYVAVLLFVLAVYTKQTELSAPIAAILVAAAIDFRLALKASAVGLVIGGAGFIVLLLSTDGGFWRHIVEYNLYNRFSLKYLIHGLIRQERDALGLLAGLTAFAFLWWIEVIARSGQNLRTWAAAMRQSQRLRALSIVSLWFALASMELVAAGKSGAADNYFIEWMCITAVPIGMAVTAAWTEIVTGGKPSLFHGVALFLSLALVMHAIHRPPFEYRIVGDAHATTLRTHMVDLIRKSGKPVLSEDMALLLRAGQQVPVDLSIFTELASTGTWDQRPLLNLIQSHAFGSIIMEESMEDAVRDGSHFTHQMASAIEHGYPSVEQIDSYRIRRPVEP
jgi:hypothetical protein